MDNSNAILNFPQSLLIALRNFLNSSKEYNTLKKQLLNTGVIIENDEYQISIPTIAKLEEIKKLLNEEEFIK